MTLNCTHPCEQCLTRDQRDSRFNLKPTNLLHLRAVARNHVRTYPCSFIGAYLAAKQPRVARLCLAPCRARSARRGSEAAAPQGARGKPLLEGDRLIRFDRIVTVASRALFLNLLSSNFGCEQANSIIFSQFCFINLVSYSL